MRVSTLCASVFSLAVCADALAHPLLGDRVPAISAASSGQAVDKRQIGIGAEPSTPPQCASSCNQANNEINLGCPLTACCTTTFQTQYYNCLECVGSTLSANNYAAAQSNLNLLYMTCVDMGFVLPQLVLPGQKAGTDTGSAFPTGSSDGTSSTTSTHTSGVAVNGRLYGVQVEELIGVVMLLCVLGLWR